MTYSAKDAAPVANRKVAPDCRRGHRACTAERIADIRKRLADAEDPPVSAFYRLYVVTNETPLGEDDRQQLIDALASAPYSSLGVIAQDVP